MLVCPRPAPPPIIITLLGVAMLSLAKCLSFCPSCVCVVFCQYRCASSRCNVRSHPSLLPPCPHQKRCKVKDNQIEDTKPNSSDQCKQATLCPLTSPTRETSLLEFVKKSIIPLMLVSVLCVSQKVTPPIGILQLCVPCFQNHDFVI